MVVHKLKSKGGADEGVNYRDCVMRGSSPPSCGWKLEALDASLG